MVRRYIITYLSTHDRKATATGKREIGLHLLNKKGWKSNETKANKVKTK